MISEEQKQKIFELRKQGKSQIQISIELKISLESISRWCKIFDPEGEYNLIKKIKTIDIENIKTYYLNNDKSLKKTITYFNNYPRGTIRDMLIKEKIYESNRKKNITKRDKSLNVINWKKDKKIKLVEYKGGKCEKCGYNKCIEALEFHHIEPSKKDFSVSSNSFSFEKMKQEVDKCILVCSNCHREIHFDIKNKQK